MCIRCHLCEAPLEPGYCAACVVETRFEVLEGLSPSSATCARGRSSTTGCATAGRPERGRSRPDSYHRLVSENEPLKDQLEEIGTRLAWVRDYL